MSNNEETAEEAAEKRIPTSTKVWDLTETRRNDFIAGALWQQEQDKKMYSEEEVRNLFNQYKKKFSLYRNIHILPAVFEEWFTQFNNK
jgi:3-methyladenine DNA glycosylase AlkC